MKMGEQDDGLSLTLTLKCAASDAAAAAAADANHDHNNNNNNNNNNLPPPPVAVPAPAPAPAPAAFPFGLVPSPYNFLHHLHHQRPGPTNFIPPALPSPADLNAEMRSYLRRLDENRLAAAAAAVAAAAAEAESEEEEEEVVVSSPNSTVSTTSLSGGKRGERDYEAERDSSSQYGVASEDDDGGDAAARKKLRLSKDQAAVLEETFKEHSTLNPKQKLALAKQLDLRPRQVEVWFQNRRARTKLKQTEVDCEYLKRCCETLTEENRRLQKEVNELRALKLSPQFYMNMNPPTTLTMCPQCERVAVSSSSSSSTVVGSSAARTTGVASTRHPNPVGPHRPKPMPATSWAKIISPQTLKAHHPQ